MNSKKKVVLIEAMILSVFLAIVFAIPSNFTAGFWCAFVFTVLSFGINVFVWLNYFSTNQKLNSRFLKISVLNVCNYYTIVQIVECLFLKFVEVIPAWVAWGINVAALAVCLVSIVTLSSATDYIQDIDKKTRNKAQLIKFLQTDIEGIACSVSNEQLKIKIESLAERVRFSDPMSQDSLIDIENLISDKVDGLKTLPESEMEKAITEIERLLVER